MRALAAVKSRSSERMRAYLVPTHHDRAGSSGMRSWQACHARPATLGHYLAQADAMSKEGEHDIASKVNSWVNGENAAHARDFLAQFKKAPGPSRPRS
jgi:hypothetical protein